MLLLKEALKVQRQAHVCTKAVRAGIGPGKVHKAAADDDYGNPWLAEPQASFLYEQADLTGSLR